MPCERCGGFMSEDEDGDRSCLQCGGRVYRLAPMPRVAEQRAHGLRRKRVDANIPMASDSWARSVIRRHRIG